MKRILKNYKKWELVWIPLSLILISAAWFLEFFLTPVELRDEIVWQIVYFIATLTGMLCVVLTSGKRWFQWVIGLINITGFILLYWRWGLYGNWALNLFFYIPASILGIYFWLKHRDTKHTSKVKIMTNKSRLILVLISVISLCLLAIPLSLINVGATGSLTLIGFLDSSGTVLGVIGQVLLNLRYTEQWAIWIILDIIMAVLNFVLGNYSLAIMYVLWTINAIIGYVVWSKSAKKEEIKNE